MNADTKVKKETYKPLEEWYYSLPANRLQEVKEYIIKHCGINSLIFYRWMVGRTSIPASSQVILNQIAGKQLYQVPMPECINSVKQA